MVRFVLSPDGQIVPDIAEKLPGRGVWVTADRASLEKAVKTGAFKRGFKGKGEAGDDLVSLTEQLLRQRVLSLMTMSLKAGQAYMGFDQVKTAAASKPLAWRIEASDGSAGGRGKIRVLTKAVSREMEKPEPCVIGCFTSDELGKAYNREAVVHAAVKSGRMKAAFDYAAGRLAGFSELVPSDWEDKSHENMQPTVKRIGDKG